MVKKDIEQLFAATRRRPLKTGWDRFLLLEFATERSNQNMKLSIK